MSTSRLNPPPDEPRAHGQAHGGAHRSHSRSQAGINPATGAPASDSRPGDERLARLGRRKLRGKRTSLDARQVVIVVRREFRVADSVS